MKLIKLLLLLGILVFVARAIHPTDDAWSMTCDGCACRSPAPTHPGVVHIDADRRGDVVRGTGIIVTAGGRVVTNDHVIRDTTGICVTTTDRSYHGTVVRMDPARDLTVLQLQGATDLVPASFRDPGTVRVGEAVTVLGNDGDRWAERGVVTDTWQSALVRDDARQTSRRLTGLIEIDTEIPAGNSGGPMLDREGRVIAMNAAGGRRVGFAIPIDQALAFARID